jgi:hypothetical protein
VNFDEARKVLRSVDGGLDVLLAELPRWSRWAYLPGIRLAQRVIRKTYVGLPR